MTTYIAIARNVTDGDADQYAVLDWTVEARDKHEAARIVRERHGNVGFALVPARFFSPFHAEHGIGIGEDDEPAFDGPSCERCGMQPAATCECDEHGIGTGARA